MATEVNVNSSLHNAELNAVLDGLVTDIASLSTALDTLVAKLNADGGVTDEDYANAAAQTVSSD